MFNTCAQAVDSTRTSCGQPASFTSTQNLESSTMGTTAAYTQTYATSMQAFVHTTTLQITSVTEHLPPLSTMLTIPTTTYINTYLGKAK